MKVYIADVKVFENPEVFEKAYRSVDTARRNKIDRYRFHNDKMLSLGVGMLLQKALSEDGIAGARLAVTLTGKPYLENNEEWFFSLSHSGSKVLCAVAEVPVGCDIEEIDDRSLNILDQVLSPEERKLFSDKGREEKAELFYMLWTGKESYLKLTGEGIINNLSEISLHIPFGSQTILGHTVTFLEIPCGNNYKAAVCAEGIREVDELQIRNIHF